MTPTEFARVEKVVAKFDSFDAAEEAEDLYWSTLDPAERLAIGFELLYRAIPRSEFETARLTDQVSKFTLAERIKRESETED